MAERHLRPVGKDCLVAFGGNLYSVNGPSYRLRNRLKAIERENDVA
ncbi:hypothetical protein ACWDX8_34580 [Streptomyces anthocyanicus]